MTKRLASLILVALALAGCQKPDETNNSGVNSPRFARAFGGTNAVNGIGGAAIGSGSGSDLTLAGYVTSASGYSDDNFQQSVKGLMNASIPENYVGYVSHTANDGRTGLFFGGRVSMNGGGVGSGNGSIASNSRLLVEIFDQYTGQKDDAGNIIPPMKIYLTQASGTINGNYANIHFYDNYGSIDLEGTFDSQFFTGLFKYDNQVKYDGSGLGGSDSTGLAFKIPTCSFFQCN